MLQMNLFEKDYTEIHKEYDIKVSFPAIKDITFAGGMMESVHRWFRLTPSYSPELVRLLLEYLDCSKSTVVADPFLGKGTTLIECKKYGYRGIGIEINPLLQKVSQFSLEWDYDLTELRRLTERFIDLVANEICKNSNLSCEQFCDQQGVAVPIIYNPFRWWKKSVLRDLLVVRTLLKKKVPIELHGPFWLALCGTALDCANVHRNHPTISFDDNHNRNISVHKDFKEKLKIIIEDIEQVQGLNPVGEAQIFGGDSVKELENIVQRKVHRIITSPPYPNRFSYIHTTRPQLYFMEILQDIQTATEIDMKAIGGTWGRATSVLMKDELKPHEDIKGILDFRNRLLQKSLLMCNYATKYFNDLFEHILALKSVVAKNFRGAYVVGNSRLMGTDIHTELYLARMFEKAGFVVDQIMFFRKRGGKRELYESAVCIRR